MGGGPSTREIRAQAFRDRDSPCSLLRFWRRHLLFDDMYNTSPSTSIEEPSAMYRRCVLRNCEKSTTELLCTCCWRRVARSDIYSIVAAGDEQKVPDVCEGREGNRNRQGKLCGVPIFRKTKKKGETGAVTERSRTLLLLYHSLPS